MKTYPKTPKILPWLAKKAGISESRAAALWHEAERWAARRAPTGSSPYFKLAVDRLLHLFRRHRDDAGQAAHHQLDIACRLAPARSVAQSLAERSVAENKDVISETLARLLAKQGYRDKAIVMYERLALSFPEKSSFFAAKIKELKK